jgi:hypothetical protein
MNTGQTGSDKTHFWWIKNISNCFNLTSVVQLQYNRFTRSAIMENGQHILSYDQELAIEEQLRFHMPNRLTAIVAAGGIMLAAVGGGIARAQTPPEQGATPTAATDPNAHPSQSDTEYGAIPDAFTLIKQNQGMVLNENPGKMFLGPDDETLNKSINWALENSYVDTIKGLRIRKMNKGAKLSLKLRQENARGLVQLALLQDPSDTDGNFIQEYDLSIDSDILDDKKVIVTPVIRAKHTANRFVKAGKTITPPDWSNINPLSAVSLTAQGANKVEYHSQIIQIKLNHAAKKSLKNGRLYLDVRQSCQAIKPSYILESNPCNQVTDLYYRVNAKHKTTNYVTGHETKPGDVILKTRST